MARVYSTRLFVMTPTSPANTDVKVYTVPAGKRTIVKRWHIIGYVGGNLALKYKVGGVTLLPQLWLVVAAAYTDYGRAEWLVLNETDEIWIWGSANYAAMVGASGVELDLP